MNSNNWKITAPQLGAGPFVQNIVDSITDWLNSTGFFPFIASIALLIVLGFILWTCFEFCAFGSVLGDVKRISNLLGGRSRGDVLSDDLACIGALFFGLMLLGLISFYLLMALYGGKTIFDGIANVVQLSFSWKLAMFLLSMILSITLTKLAIDMASKYFGALADEATAAAEAARKEEQSKASRDAISSIADAINKTGTPKLPTSTESPKIVANTPASDQASVVPDGKLKPKVEARLRAAAARAKARVAAKLKPAGQT